MPKLIDEYVGALNNKETRISVAHMRSPAGWQEPGQTPEFDEYTIVLRGRMRVEHRQGILEVQGGQGVLARAGEWVRYSTPDEATEYIAICLPAFSPASVHRDQ
jgi:mannose-6-phosphate isomerase-like protein (cupin superfamily)